MLNRAKYLFDSNMCRVSHFSEEGEGHSGGGDSGGSEGHGTLSGGSSCRLLIVQTWDDQVLGISGILGLLLSVGDEVLVLFNVLLHLGDILLGGLISLQLGDNITESLKVGLEGGFLSLSFLDLLLELIPLCLGVFNDFLHLLHIIIVDLGHVLHGTLVLDDVL